MGARRAFPIAAPSEITFNRRLAAEDFERIRPHLKTDHPCASTIGFDPPRRADRARLFFPETGMVSLILFARGMATSSRVRAWSENEGLVGVLCRAGAASRISGEAIVQMPGSALQPEHRGCCAGRSGSVIR